MESRLEARRAQVAGAAQLRTKIDRTLDDGPGFRRNRDGSYTFRGDSGDGSYTVTATKSGVVVRDTVTGQAYRLSAAKARKGVTIDGGAGNDVIDASSSSKRIALRGGGGDDLITGGRGHDQLLGGEGNDLIAGGAGSDFIRGGDGIDQLDAGTGGDQIYADREDRIHAGEDRDVDVIVGERGTPAAQGLSGRDRAFRYDPERVDEWLKKNPRFDISGSADFEARTRADIGVMLTTKQGRGLLRELSRALKKKDETLRIRERTEGPSGSIIFKTNRIEIGQWSDGATQTPLPILFHELAHAYQDLIAGFPPGSTRFRGGRVPNFERQATGLSYRGADGEIHSGEELRYTDNKFRRELGLAERTTYSGERGRPRRYLNGYGSS